MQFYSTNHKSENVGLEEAIFRGLPQDNGLYMPVAINPMTDDFFAKIDRMSFREISYEVSKRIIGDSVPHSVLREIVETAINFDTPLVQVEDDMYCLELFHGPSHAFKDFGARFMARLMSFYLQKTHKEINILVATSGDTGGAVALGFLNQPGINVTILYPSGMVSNIQEKQLTTLGGNITAIEIKGTFDDCQKLVKQAFLDSELTKKKNLSSANSINIARLIPQSFYYYYAYSKLKAKGKPVSFSIPSGNFGNLTAGLIAKRMGLPVEKFVASTNVNNVIPEYLETGKFNPRPSVSTLSNAMDVGNPSNFARMAALYENNVDKIREDVEGYYFTDEQTKEALAKVYAESHYIMCPHTAVAYLGLKAHMDKKTKKESGVFLGTAHPAKFMDVIQEDIASHIVLPASLKVAMSKEKKSIQMAPDFRLLKDFLLK
ncbi:MAG: L-threonine synthase [Bacteroidota bacterium]